MKSISELFRDACVKIREKGYENLYIAIDVHGTIFYPSMQTIMQMKDGSSKPSETVCSIGIRNDFEFYPDAEKCLQILSNMPNVKLVLWTSTYWQAKTQDFLEKHGIKVYAINYNPDFNHSKYADFSIKFYFDMLLDDKAGFDGERDWTELLHEIETHNSNGLDSLLKKSTIGVDEAEW